MDRDIQALLSGVRHNGAEIGVDHWGPGGRDRGLVCVLTRSTGRSVAPDDFFVTSLANGAIRRANDGPHQQLDLVPIDLPTARDDLNWLVYLFAHECGHAFGLGDEYGEPETRKGGEFERFKGTDIVGSVVPEPSRPRHPAKGGRPNEIDARLAKWASWLRISHAAVVTGRPAPSGNELRLEVRAGANKFEVGQRVRLRQVLVRRNAEHLLDYHDPQRSGPLKVKARPGRHPPRARTRRGARGSRVPLAQIGTTVTAHVVAAPVIVYRPTRHPIPGYVKPTEVPVLSPLIATTSRRPTARSTEG